MGFQPLLSCAPLCGCSLLANAPERTLFSLSWWWWWDLWMSTGTRKGYSSPHLPSLCFYVDGSCISASSLAYFAWKEGLFSFWLHVFQCPLPTFSVIVWGIAILNSLHFSQLTLLAYSHILCLACFSSLCINDLGSSSLSCYTYSNPVLMLLQIWPHLIYITES